MPSPPLEFRISLIPEELAKYDDKDIHHLAQILLYDFTDKLLIGFDGEGVPKDKGKSPFFNDYSGSKEDWSSLQLQRPYIAAFARFLREDNKLSKELRISLYELLCGFDCVYTFLDIMMSVATKEYGEECTDDTYDYDFLMKNPIGACRYIRDNLAVRIKA